MSKISTRIAVPIILIGIFSVVVFLAMDPEKIEPGFYMVVLFLAIFVFFFGLAIGENVSYPVKKLLDRATQLSNGNLSSRVYLPSKDELAQLADVFNKIADELKVSRDQEANIEKSVGIKVQAKTEELQETINALEQKVKNRTVELERLAAESKKMQEEAKELRQKLG
jgi:methyl-accepting chemotaxis protein